MLEVFKMSKGKLSLTFRVEDGVVEHNNRKYIAKNVDKDRIKDNIIYKTEDLCEKYKELFDKAVEEYNALQRSKHRINRCIDNYYDYVKKSQKEKLYYEAVIQIGNMGDCGIGKENCEAAKAMLDEYMLGFEKKKSEYKSFQCRYAFGRSHAAPTY